MSNGKGCICGAYGECECGCGADWTPQEIYDLRKKVAELEAELKDRDDWFKARMSEDCPTDEVHCGCVPELKKRVQELEAELKSLKAEVPNMKTNGKE